MNSVLFDEQSGIMFTKSINNVFCLFGRMTKLGQYLLGHCQAGQKCFSENVFYAEIHKPVGVASIACARNNLQVRKVADDGLRNAHGFLEVGDREYE